MPELCDVFRLHGRAYREKYGRTMLSSHHRAMNDIMNCRTEALGGHVLICQKCGHKVYSYHSCKSRACPKCHINDTEAWMEKRRQEVLPTQYFHVIITLPAQWRRTFSSNQKVLYSIVMRAAAAAIIKLAADKKHVGGQVGVMAVLHTWTRTMVYHPHVHCLVTGGGASRDNQHWQEAKPGYLFPKRALSKVFRGIFIEMLREEQPSLQLPKRVTGQKWVAHVKAAGQGTEAVLGYLARYVHRTAICNSRILEVTDKAVTFSYRDNRDQRQKTMSLPPEEFIRRFLQHVLPKGFHRVRYYGLWSTARQNILKKIQVTLAWLIPAFKSPRRVEQEKESAGKAIHPMEGRDCPVCHNGRLVWRGRVPPWGRKPP